MSQHTEYVCDNCGAKSSEAIDYAMFSITAKSSSDTFKWSGYTRTMELCKGCCERLHLPMPILIAPARENDKLNQAKREVTFEDMVEAVVDAVVDAKLADRGIG